MTPVPRAAVTQARRLQGRLPFALTATPALTAFRVAACCEAA